MQKTCNFSEIHPIQLFTISIGFVFYYKDCSYNIIAIFQACIDKDTMATLVLASKLSALEVLRIMGTCKFA